MNSNQLRRSVLFPLVAGVVTLSFPCFASSYQTSDSKEIETLLQNFPSFDVSRDEKIIVEGLGTWGKEKDLGDWDIQGKLVTLKRQLKRTLDCTRVTRNPSDSDDEKEIGVRKIINRNENPFPPITCTLTTEPLRFSFE
jgi:hypothetical protein